MLAPINDRLREQNKSAVDVAADYLRMLWSYAKEEIKKGTGMDDWEDIYSIKAVVTVPAVWSPRAKEYTKQAATRAGLPDDLTLVSEPEAAALTVLKEQEAEGGLEVGDVFVVCDAGGGTVVSKTCVTCQPVRSNVTIGSHFLYSRECSTAKAQRMCSWDR